MRRFQDPKLGDGQTKASPFVSRIFLEAALALNNSVGDRQLHEPLHFESLLVRSNAEIVSLRVYPISWGAQPKKFPACCVVRPRAMKISNTCSFHSVAALLGGRFSPSDLAHDVFTNALAEFPHAPRHPTCQGHVEHPSDVFGHERLRLAVAA